MSPAPNRSGRVWTGDTAGWQCHRLVLSLPLFGPQCDKLRAVTTISAAVFLYWNNIRHGKKRHPEEQTNKQRSNIHALDLMRQAWTHVCAVAVLTML